MLDIFRICGDKNVLLIMVIYIIYFSLISLAQDLSILLVLFKIQLFKKFFYFSCLSDSFNIYDSLHKLLVNSYTIECLFFYLLLFWRNVGISFIFTIKFYIYNLIFGTYCYSLEVCVPLEFTCWNPNPQGDGIRKWDIWQVRSLGHQVRALMISALVEETPER
jgi:hypothetical protein